MPGPRQEPQGPIYSSFITLLKRKGFGGFATQNNYWEGRSRRYVCHGSLACDFLTSGPLKPLWWWKITLRLRSRSPLLNLHPARHLCGSDICLATLIDSLQRLGHTDSTLPGPRAETSRDRHPPGVRRPCRPMDYSQGRFRGWRRSPAPPRPAPGAKGVQLRFRSGQGKARPGLASAPTSTI